MHAAFSREPLDDADESFGRQHHDEQHAEPDDRVEPVRGEPDAVLIVEVVTGPQPPPPIESTNPPTAPSGPRLRKRG